MVQCSLFYDAPTQVKYFDSDFNAFMIGIAIGSQLITNDGDCVDIDFILDMAAKRGIQQDDAIVELSWKNLE